MKYCKQGTWLAIAVILVLLLRRSSEKFSQGNINAYRYGFPETRPVDDDDRVLHPLYDVM